MKIIFKEYILYIYMKTHQEIGNNLKLFFFHEYSAGSCFFLPHGTILYNNLINYMRKLYLKYGYNEVNSPNIANEKLWKISGHWEKYKENMFIIENCKHNKSDVEDKPSEQYALKSMNCPLHCLIFLHMNPSYRDLPLRLADFGVLHRNELSGSLHGLTRVRKFSQDDAHIFCMESQIESEITKVITMIKEVYKIFGFEFGVELSTRPEKYIGDLDTWNKSEEILTKIIKIMPKWEINEGDGAFYGPKIDISVKDSLNREHQLATIQLDFNLPEKFKLKYIKESKGDNTQKYDRPVIIHRAIYGSLERFIGIMLEHTQGVIPQELTPRLACIIPIVQEDETHIKYANNIKNMFPQDKLSQVEIDLSNNTLNKKIRTAEVMKFVYIIIIGNNEVKNNNITLRINKAYYKKFPKEIQESNKKGIFNNISIKKMFSNFININSV